MSVLFVLIPLALLLATGAVSAFLWAVSRGEFEDLETPALRVVWEDEEIERGERV